MNQKINKNLRPIWLKVKFEPWYFTISRKKSSRLSVSQALKLHSKIRSFRKLQFTINFKKFSEGNFSIEDEERSGLPAKLRDKEFLELIALSSSIIVEELAEVMDVTEQTIRNHLHKLGYTCKLTKWVPHQLTSFNKFNRKHICEFLLDWSEREHFFPNLELQNRHSWLRSDVFSTKIQFENLVVIEGLR